MSEQGHDLPSTSTMALSFAEVQQQLPAGVTLEKALGASVLTIKLDAVKPAVISVFSGLGWAAYAAFMAPELGPVVPLGALAFFAYFAAAFALGKRRATVDGSGLQVRTLPLPLPGDGSTQQRIDRIDVVIVGFKSASRISYRIDAVILGKRRPLVQDIVDQKQAMVLARYLAGELRVPVPTSPIQLF